MDTKFSKPKGFGQILDHTFSLSKQRFSEFFLIFLILMGPIYLLSAIVQMASGVHFFREVGSGSNWFERAVNGLAESDQMYTDSLGIDIGIIIVALISIFVFPVAVSAVMLAINHIRKNEAYTIGSVIKEAFSRYGAILGSNILYGLIVFGFITLPIIFIVLIATVGGIIHPVIGVLLGIALFLGCAVFLGYFLTRWSFFLGSVLFDHDSPGLSRSWGLTKKRTWVSLGLYIVFFLIISSISFTLEITLGLLLGNSVLLSIIVNLVSLATAMLFTVGYTIMYFDLKIRHDADDLKEMLEDYKPI